ncbi:MAG: hydrogenase formation protein HypD [Fibrobacter sp.]|nr:hydrogenase formation protein HypD [Fibrobacter sp.]
MNLREDFRNQRDCRALAERICFESRTPVSIMEVCGGHTMALQRHGIPSLLPETVSLISGPGCPVCVSDIRFIDHAVALAREPGVVIATYGDLIRVPGSTSSLEKEKANGASVKVVWSALEALTFASANPGLKVVFLGIGFETTSPGTAIAVIEAAKASADNFFVLSSHKVMPPAMTALIDEGVRIDAYLCPGHVSVITGSSIYEPIAGKYHKPCVVSGFEPSDILQSIWMIIKQVESGDARVEIQYSRAVRPEGNLRAQKVIEEVFVSSDDYWRGLGNLPKSGLKLAEKYSRFDAAEMIPVKIEETRESAGCICGDVLKGIKKPNQCKLFRTACTPNHPVGACMVSSEGTCSAYFQYGDNGK